MHHDTAPDPVLPADAAAPDDSSGLALFDSPEMMQARVAAPNLRRSAARPRPPQSIAQRLECNDRTVGIPGLNALVKAAVSGCTRSMSKLHCRTQASWQVKVSVL